jgi:hypothetical protein
MKMETLVASSEHDAEAAGKNVDQQLKLLQ